MAIKALVEIRDWRFNGADLADLEVEFEVKALNGATQGITRSTPHANVSASNFESAIKNILTTYAQNRYGVTLHRMKFC